MEACRKGFFACCQAAASLDVAGTPTRLFCPVFWDGWERFAGVQSACRLQINSQRGHLYRETCVDQPASHTFSPPSDFSGFSLRTITASLLAGRLKLQKINKKISHGFILGIYTLKTQLRETVAAFIYLSVDLFCAFSGKDVAGRLFELKGWRTGMGTHAYPKAFPPRGARSWDSLFF